MLNEKNIKTDQEKYLKFRKNVLDKLIFRDIFLILRNMDESFFDKLFIVPIEYESLKEDLWIDYCSSIHNINLLKNQFFRKHQDEKQAYSKFETFIEKFIIELIIGKIDYMVKSD